MRLDEIPGMEISSYPADPETLKPLVSTGLFDEDQARVVAAGFSLAKIRPAGPYRKGFRKVGGYTSKLWSWIIPRHTTLAVLWLEKLHLRQRFRPVQIAIQFSDPSSDAPDSIVFIFFARNPHAQPTTPGTYRLDSAPWRDHRFNLCQWENGKLVERLSNATPRAIISFLNQELPESN